MFLIVLDTKATPEECENCYAQGMLQLQPHRPHFTAPGKKFVPNVWAPAYQAESPELVCKGVPWLRALVWVTRGLRASFFMPPAS